MGERAPIDLALPGSELDEIVAIRRSIHAHPEMGFEEQRTSNLVAERLTRWGIEVHRGMARTGVIGLIQGRDGGACGRAVGLRADMDALPIQEKNLFAHASVHAQCMHACGHDGHTAMLLAAARRLAATRAFDGTAVLIFQPAEEGLGGAQAMVAEGLFQKYPMQAVFGLHNWPGYPTGTIAFSPGPVMASANTFKVVVRGKGSHGAMPHQSIDPVLVASHVVSALQSVVSRSLNPLETVVLSVTMVHAGEATNVIPDACSIEGTVRTYKAEVTALMEQRMRSLAEHTCAAWGAGCEFEFLRRAPATVNHAQEAVFAATVAAEVVGADKALVQEQALPSEDFAFMLQAQAGAYGFIGNGDGAGAHRMPQHGAGPCVLHNASYDFNDALLPVGAAFWVRLAQRWLARLQP